MIEEIPLQPIPSQKVLCVLNRQNLYFLVKQRLNRLYITLLVNDSEMFGGIICRDRLPLKQSRTQTLIGNVVFKDTEGTSDPVYTGLGTRFQLLYFDNETLPDNYQTPIIDQDPSKEEI